MFGAGDDAPTRLAKVSASLAKNRAALKAQRHRFDVLLREAEQPEISPDDLEALAKSLLDYEKQASGNLAQAINWLESILARNAKKPHTDYGKTARRYSHDSLEIARSWLELYQNVRIRLLKLASDRRVAAGETGSPILSDAGDMELYLRRLVGE